MLTDVSLLLNVSCFTKELEGNISLPTSTCHYPVVWTKEMAIPAEDDDISTHFHWTSVLSSLSRFQLRDLNEWTKDFLCAKMYVHSTLERWAPLPISDPPNKLLFPYPPLIFWTHQVQLWRHHPGLLATCCFWLLLTMLWCAMLLLICCFAGSRCFSSSYCFCCGGSDLLGKYSLLYKSMAVWILNSRCPCVSFPEASDCQGGNGGLDCRWVLCDPGVYRIIEGTDHASLLRHI